VTDVACLGGLKSHLLAAPSARASGALGSPAHAAHSSGSADAEVGLVHAAVRALGPKGCRAPTDGRSIHASAYRAGRAARRVGGCSQRHAVCATSARSRGGAAGRPTGWHACSVAKGQKLRPGRKGSSARAVRESFTRGTDLQLLCAMVGLPLQIHRQPRPAHGQVAAATTLACLRMTSPSIHKAHEWRRVHWPSSIR
jgi:hypothetical protein